jgi:osmotically-inducible protein OsmY
MRSTLVATAIAATLALGACGDGRDDSAATRDNTPVASNSTGTPASPYATDRMTADASSASSRANDNPSTTGRSPTADAERANERVKSNTLNANDPQRTGGTGDRAAAAAGDAALTAKVKAALMAEPGIDSLQIDVDTANGRVTLTGEADSAQNRQRALQVARNVDGVSGVVDRLSVKR